MRKLSSKRKISFYNARKREGDAKKVANRTGYSIPHVINVREGRRVNDEIASEFYNISRRRMTNMERFNKN